MQRFRVMMAAIAALAAGSIVDPSAQAHPTVAKAKRVAWTNALVDLAAFNKDLVAGKPTMDVVVYFPSNFDPAFKKVTLEQMLDGVRAAKEIYQPAGVQINLAAVRTGAIDPRFFAIQANEIPRLPDTEYMNMYEANKLHPSELTDMARAAFDSMIESRKDSSRTIYLVALQDVIMPFLEVSEGRNWTIKMVRTGGLSFPSYSYYGTIPAAYRGVITITNLSNDSRAKRTIAHEIGHKVMNVSHEYKTTSPAHEVYADGGLMLYGSGVDIPSGADGRWHLERLLMSPYIYRLQSNGTKQWNPEYKDGGHYYDPLYGEKIVRFPGVSNMDPNW